MTLPHPHFAAVAALMAICATSLAQAAENSGIRLIYERMPTATSTDLKVSTPTGDIHALHRQMIRRGPRRAEHRIPPGVETLIGFGQRFLITTESTCLMPFQRRFRDC